MVGRGLTTAVDDDLVTRIDTQIERVLELGGVGERASEVRHWPCDRPTTLMDSGDRKPLGREGPPVLRLNLPESIRLAGACDPGAGDDALGEAEPVSVAPQKNQRVLMAKEGAGCCPDGEVRRLGHVPRGRRHRVAHHGNGGGIIRIVPEATEVIPALEKPDLKPCLAGIFGSVETGPANTDDKEINSGRHGCVPIISRFGAT